MTIADWANWAMVIEAVGAIFVFPIVGTIWRQHRTIVNLREQIHKLERELDTHEKAQKVQGPRNRR
jgi:hypothetical protein